MYMALGISNAWHFKEWVNQFRVNIQHKDDLDMQFDMVGIDPAIANAFRRILIAEVPSMAIEHVFYINNTSIITVETHIPAYFVSGCPQEPVDAANANMASHPRFHLVQHMLCTG